MVTKRPKGLGLGLDALLGPKVSDSTATEGLPTTLRINQLQAGRYQPRTRMDEGSLYELAESIKSQGVMQPILVRPLASPSSAKAGMDKSRGPLPATRGSGSTVQQYEIIAGERRFRASQLAGLNEVPVLVKEVPDEAAAVMALIENIQREDLNPLEEAQGLKRLVDEFQLTHEQAAQAVGRSRTAATNLLRLLQLSPAVQDLLMAGDLDMGHARALLGLDGAQQVTSAHEVVAKKLSVRETEKLVARHAAGRQKPLLRVMNEKPRDLLNLEEELSDLFAATVEIRVLKRGKKDQSGELAIAFGSLDALQGVIERLRGPQ